MNKKFNPNPQRKRVTLHPFFFYLIYNENGELMAEESISDDDIYEKYTDIGEVEYNGYDSISSIPLSEIVDAYNNIDKSIENIRLHERSNYDHTCTEPQIIGDRLETKEEVDVRKAEYDLSIEKQRKREEERAEKTLANKRKRFEQLKKELESLSTTPE